MIITADKIEIGTEFKTSSRQRKWRYLKKKTMFKETDKVPRDMVGQYLFILDDCSQMVFDKSEDLIINV